MKKHFIIVIMICIGSVGICFSQPLQVDTSRQVLPPLELPEITIVGKKAITLPFARKGEKYDVSVYQAPLPDSSLVGERQDISFLPASIPDYKERRRQWHLSFNGFAGSIGSGGVHSYITYDNETWKLDGRAGFSGTRGHVHNADASSGMLGIDAGTLLKTDNNILKTLSVSLGTEFSRQSYGMFGIPSPSTDRTANKWSMSAGLHSLDRSDNVLDIHFRTSSLSLNDRVSSLDSRVTSLSPEINAAFTKSIQSVKLTAGISYISSSEEYSSYSANPTLVLFHASAQWKLNRDWIISAGGLIGSGSGNRSLVSPAVNVAWSISPNSMWEFWLRPRLELTTYDEYIGQNPYLKREIVVQPERAPLNIGTTYSIQMNSLSMDVTASFTRFSDKSIMVADSGRIGLDYVKANQVKFEFNGAASLIKNIDMKVNAIIQPTYEDGTTKQLPMIPLFKLSAKAEYTFDTPLTVWASLDCWSRQHVDRQGSKELSAPIILGAGLSTSIIRQVVLSAQVTNLVNTGYEWWSGYPAPGREFRMMARLNIL